MKKYYRHVVVVVALSLLALSLRHLAHGVATVTGVSDLEAGLMAVGIDLAMVAAELAYLAGVRSVWTRGLILATCVLSAGFNCLGFLEHAQGALGQVLAITLGVFVPAAVYGLTDTLNRSRVLDRKVAKRVRAKVTRSDNVRQIRSA